jgi:hypothetical protein
MRSAKIVREESNVEPIATYLGRVSQELVDLADLVANLEDAVGAAIQEQPSSADIRIEELQKLDLIRQQSAALSDFLAAVANACHNDWLIDVRHAGSLLRLSGLASRLTLTHDHRPGEPDSMPGECEMF